MLALEQLAEKWPFSAGGGVVQPLRPPVPPGYGLQAKQAQRPLPSNRALNI